MRWERLFAEIEAQSHDMTLDDRDAEIRDLTEGAWASMSWLERMSPGPVVLTVSGVGRIDGDLVRKTGAWLLVQSPTHEHLVNPAWITSASPARSAGPSSVVDQRLDWPAAIRMLQRSADRVRIVRADGSVSDGMAKVAGKDFVELVTDHGIVEMTPYAMLAVIRCRRVP